MSTIPTSSIFPPVASGGGSTDPEIVRDTIASALVAGTGVTITVDDPGNTITIDATGSGGGATGGTATLDFGGIPGTGQVSAVVTGQAGIVSGSRVRAWIQGSTADHNAYEHTRILPGRIGLAAGDIVAGTGFTIYAETELRLTGDVAVAWEWA